MIVNNDSNEFFKYIDNGPYKKIIINNLIQTEDNSLNEKYTINNDISILDYLREKQYNETSYDVLFKSKTFTYNKFDSEPNTIFDDVDQFKTAVVENFKINIMSEDLEFGLIGNTTKDIEKFLNINPDYTVNAITKLALDHFEDVNLVYSVLHTLAHVDYNLIEPAGVTFALMASRHENIEIQDYSIQCFDMWESKESLGYLKVINIDTPWLKDYLEEVISNIESINV